MQHLIEHYVHRYIYSYIMYHVLCGLPVIILFIAVLALKISGVDRLTESDENQARNKAHELMMSNLSGHVTISDLPRHPLQKV